jgi:hypothetical protein
MSAAYDAGDICKFCNGPNAGYGRRDEHGKYQPACYECAKKPYPVPAQFQKAESKAPVAQEQQNLFSKAEASR